MGHFSRNWSRALRAGALVAGVVATGGCASWMSSVGSPGVVEVVAGDRTFTPAHVTIYEGTTIRWVNKSAVAHTLISSGEGDGAPFASELASGASFELTFHTAGDQRYYCREHESAGMAGMVTVLPAPLLNGDNAISEY